jgi:hypothetical protein
VATAHKVVCEYSPQGKVVWEVKTPNMPFTVIRLDNGNTLIGCTLGHLVIEVDKEGKTVWQVTNDDLPGPKAVAWHPQGAWWADFGG